MAQHSYSRITFSRTLICKAVILLVFTVMLLDYSYYLFSDRKPINKIVAPGLAWISHLNQKLSDTKALSNNSFLPLKPHNILLNRSLVSESSNSSKLYSSKVENKNISLNFINSSHLEPSTECPLIPPKLVGRLKVLTESPPFVALEQMFTDLNPGGRFKPNDCLSRSKVALIIPYRDREEHLRIFLHNVHPILQRQQLDYGIYIIEETANMKFNRAMLMNIGYVEASKQYPYDCFIFHDVDLIPEDDRNLYNCPEQPRHMSVAINTMNYRLPYKDIFGGVSALSKKHMKIVNGFSNEFWGWGGEDDDMSNRIKHHGLKISRYSSKIARYTMLKHKKDEPNPDRYNKLYKGKYRYTKDGLSNLKYKRLEIVFKKLYTWVLVEIEPIK
ncbi:beta-1,4-N-acetylgalactosaminyltransferase bre-4-like [Parasteatoda tepidariorum]|uniref:beta-1,4-N-acetylgalactosaminyltransferase bre-4-like n=1 Tax=Parasteatoda tepidariorum TaxID=114398 RepID=UPI000A2C0E1E|nr:beta-1,4-N-acetylgalactosaminyltransferase bre-4 [Parasteatoda tepidariorum]XP_042910353.1 beta-1,4-N-acetylgalactosaminyltransferase bre-4 [Parasteatoda tepidariorum]XP_042913363.1 beta-1,4-N-acetylgalactosaminyltransferase bre-4-like [Parasteatoda tepidariorum]